MSSCVCFIFRNGIIKCFIYGLGITVITGSTDKSVCTCVVCVHVCLFLDYFGMAEVLKMKVRVELMVVKGPSVYLVLVNMKYNLSLPLSLSVAVAVCYVLWVSVVCSPLKAEFVCSHRGGSLGNLITRLKALSIRQITRSVCASLFMRVCIGGCVCVCLQAYTVSAYACVSTGCPLSTTPGSPERQQAGRNTVFF